MPGADGLEPLRDNDDDHDDDDDDEVLPADYMLPRRSVRWLPLVPLEAAQTQALRAEGLTSTAHGTVRRRVHYNTWSGAYHYVRLPVGGPFFCVCVCVCVCVGGGGHTSSKYEVQTDQYRPFRHCSQHPLLVHTFLKACEPEALRMVELRRILRAQPRSQKTLLQFKVAADF